MSLDFNPITLLVGANDSGKSTVLQAIHFANAVAQTRMALNLPRWNFTAAPSQILYAPVTDPAALSTALSFSQKNAISIGFTMHGLGSGKVELVRGKNSNLTVSLTGATTIPRLQSLETFFSVYVPGLSGISKAEVRMDLGVLRRAAVRGDANLALRNVLLALKQDAEQWKQFLLSLEEIFPKRSPVVTYRASVDEHVAVSVRAPELGGQAVLPLESSGTGYLQVVQILSYMFLFKPAVLLLDEPDAHLHPSNQRQLANMLTTLAAQTQTQLLIATHSRTLFGELREHSQVLWMKRGKLAPQQSYATVLMDIGALDAAESIVSGGVQLVILTEDEALTPLRTLVGANTVASCQLISYRGCSNLNNIRPFVEFVRQANPKAKLVVHRDSDYLLKSDMDRLRDQFKLLKVPILFTRGVDVESYFCNEEHLKHVNASNGGLLPALFKQVVDELQEDFRKKAKEGRKNQNDINHKGGHGSVSNAEIDQWAKNLDLKSDSRWIRGKDFLKKLRGAFQTRTGTNLKVFENSPHLIDAEIAKLVKPD